MGQFYIPSSVAVAAWAMIALLVTGYTVKAFQETAPGH
jgi:hypothetical protein